MATEYKAKLNIFTGQLQLVPTNVVLAFKAAVANQAALPLTGNAKGDARIANDTGILWVWSLEASSGLLTDWVDAGDIIDLNWSAISGKPSSAVADIDDAVSKRHTQNSDTILAEGTADEIAANQILKATTSNINYYIDNVSGSDLNPGTIDEPFQTVNYALDLLPKVINHRVNIYLKDSLTYSESEIRIENFCGNGTIYIGSLSGNADNVLLTGALNEPVISAIYNQPKLYIYNISIRVNGDNKSCIRVVGSENVGVVSCKLSDNDNVNTLGISVSESGKVGALVISDYDTKKVSVGLKASGGGSINYYSALFGDTNTVVEIGGIISDAIVLNKVDYDSAISLKHASGSDNQTADTVPTSASGVSVQDHIDNTSNPHSVTKTQVGLGNVDDKSEATIITDVKADSDVADALSKRHASGSDNQTADTVPTEDSGVSVQDALNTLEGVSHAASGQINQATAAEISGLTDKATPVDADVILGEDSAHVTPFSKIKITWSNIKSTLKSYFDTVYQAALGFTAVPDTRTVNTHALTGNVTVVADDIPTSESGLTVQDKLDSIINPMLYKGGITLAADFPTLALVKTGWTYTILADVTDNDVTKTNTEQSFLQNAEIAWNGTNWTQLGYSAVKSVAGKTGIVTLAKADVGLGNVTDGAQPPSMCIAVFERSTSVTVGNGKADIIIPSYLNGMNLVRAQAIVITAGTTNATTVAVYNATDSQEMLSANISIASGDTVGTVGTIDTAHDDVQTNDVLRIDIDAVSTTAPLGLIIVLEFA